MKILLVDDNRYACDALYEFLEMLPYECDFTYSGKKAAALLLENSYDILISDLNMPDVNGEALLELVTQEKLSTRILMISGDDGTQKAFSLLEKGVYGFLKKPIDVFRLSDMLKDFVRYRECEEAQEALLRNWERQGKLAKEDFCPEKLAMYLEEGPGRAALFTDAPLRFLRSAYHILSQLHRPLLLSGPAGAGKKTLIRLLAPFMKHPGAVRSICCREITDTLLHELELLPSTTMLIFNQVQECPAGMWKSWLSWLEKEFTLCYSSRGERKFPPIFTLDQEAARETLPPDFFLRLAPYILVVPALKQEDRSLFYALLYEWYLEGGEKDGPLTLEHYQDWIKREKTWTYAMVQALLKQRA